MLKTIVTILFFFLACPLPLWATDWFVRPAGGNYGAENGSSYNNAWDGFSKITWGVGGVKAGDTLYVCGTHNEQFTVGATGSSGKLIDIRGDYPSDSGFINTNHSTTYCIYINDKSHIKVQNIMLTGASSAAIYIYQNIGDMTDIHIDSAAIADSERGVWIIGGRNGSFLSNLSVSNSTISRISNHAIDATFGEVDAHDSGTLHTVEVKNNTINNVGGAAVQVHPIYGCNPYSDSRCYGVDINGNTINESKNVAVRLVTVSGVTSPSYIRNNTINAAGYGETLRVNAIRLAGCDSITVEANEVFGTLTSTPRGDGNAIILDSHIIDGKTNYCTNCIVKRNYLHDNIDGGGAGVHCGWGRNCQICYNLIISNRWGISVRFPTSTGNEINNNTIYNSRDDCGGNSCAAWGGSGIVLYDSAPPTIIKNNIIANCSRCGITVKLGAVQPISDYNCIYDCGANFDGCSKGPNSKEQEDPLFIDPNTTHFQLKSTSCCMAGGTVVREGQHTIDYAGVLKPPNARPSMGAYEARTISLPTGFRMVTW